MQVIFSVRGDSQVDAHLVGEWPIFNDALQDSISTMPPRGLRERTPSLYWIDVAESGARRASKHEEDDPFTSGNHTELRMRAGMVVAAYDWAAEGEPDEEMTVEEFLTLLADWRERVIQVRSSPWYRAAAIVARMRAIGRYQVRRNPLA